MDPVIIVIIVVVVLLIIVALVVLLPRMRGRADERKQEQARDHRQEAQRIATQAESSQAAADEKAAAARRERAEAELRAADAQREAEASVTEADRQRAEAQRLEEKAAKQRQGARNDLVETFHQVPPQKTRDKIGTFAGKSGRTVEKIAAVVAAAEAEPEKFAPLVDDMDRIGRVDGPYRRLCNMQAAEPP